MALIGFTGLPTIPRISPASDLEIQKIVNLEYPEEDNDAMNLGAINFILTLDGGVLTLNGNVLILH